MNKCRLNNMEIYGIYEERHENRKFPSLIGIKVAYQGFEENMDKLCFIN
jgi:hypothetical protein